MISISVAEHLIVPATVTNHGDFRRWVTADDFPEKARASYLNGNVWVDLPMERLAHNQCKLEITTVLSGLVKAEDSGINCSDGMLLTHLEVGLSTQPEYMFITHESVESGRVTLLRGDDTIEVIGSPDMTLEVVSPTSVDKDTVQLRRLYWEAGVREYWLVDSREKSFTFDILRRTATKFVPTRKHQGWIRSQVFGCEFELTRETGKLGLTNFALDVR